ncbi:MAG: PAS-domain containing protein, partial [Methylocapsa sp.]|nr:PAS-domain containing protein [Methylocapsa sp.]
AQFALAAGLAASLALAAAFHFFRWRRWAGKEAELFSRLAGMQARLGWAEALLASEPQVTIAWSDAGKEPQIEENAGLIAREKDPRAILDFRAWLAPETALKLEDSAAQLRERGLPFWMKAASLDGRLLDIEGRPVGAIAVVRIRVVPGEHLDAPGLQSPQEATREQLQAIRSLLDAVPFPAWVRDGRGKLAWVNPAYARAVEANDQEAAVSQGTELVESLAREAGAVSRKEGKVWRGRAPAIVAGKRRMLEIVDTPAGASSAGMAVDVSELESLRASLDQQSEAHQRTLNQLATAVAIFDGSKRLIFSNTAYCQLWALDQAWLDEKPTDSEILDRLRAARLLPEEADFRAWKLALFGAYQSLETEDQVWFLPDGRTLRAGIGPNAQGGVTYLFDDVTERYRLASQYKASMRVQTETLDALREGVAVFGSDGRLKFLNPAFAALWSLDPEDLTGQPHIDRVARLCAPLYADEESWAALRGAIAGLPEERVGFERRLARRDGSVLDCAAAPLPDGSALLTFTDMTASVNIERALTERNEALIERNQALLDAERLRNDFVHHVSYELRSPLTNITGFIQLLGDPAIGGLNAKQREYAGYVTKSSAALLALIDDILDLASIDADAIELSLEDVDIAQLIRAAANDVADRLAEASLRLVAATSNNIGTFRADGRRMRQILFNLLTNAIGFSSPGQSIGLTAARKDGSIYFRVTDHGSGIPAAIRDHVFDRFRTYTAGSRHRGAGLGLSIVRSFVELHGGRVEIDSVPGKKTFVTCIFPAGGKS